MDNVQVMTQNSLARGHSEAPRHVVVGSGHIEQNLSEMKVWDF